MKDLARPGEDRAPDDGRGDGADGRLQGCKDAMTRENKLALVVGFGLILFVGILISDHFSVAQNQNAAKLTSENVLASRKPDFKNRDLIDLTNPSANQSAKPAMVPSNVPPQGHELEPQNPLPSGDPALEPALDPGASDTRYAINEHGGNGVESTPDVIRMPNPYGPETIGSRSPNEKSHTVGKGETLYAIARNEYGDGSLWKKLLDYNKNVVPSADNMRPGVTLRLPSKEVLTGKPAAEGSLAPETNSSVGTPSRYRVVDSRSSQPLQARPNEYALAFPVKQDDATRGLVTGGTVRPVDTESSKRVEPRQPSKNEANAQPPTTKAASKSATRSTEYTVRNGDTLAKISQKVLGSTARWPEIYEMNRDAVPDLRAIKPGTVLKVPSA